MQTEKQTIIFGNDSSGIKIQYTKSREKISMFGWYDHYCGIEGGSMGLKDFFQKLGIDSKTLRKIANKMDKELL